MSGGEGQHTSTTCDSPVCEENTPWDMVEIQMDHKSFCSPNCARDFIMGSFKSPEKVTLHDPQYHLNRDSLDGVAEDAINITREVTDEEDALRAIDEIEEMYPLDFRPEK